MHVIVELTGSPQPPSGWNPKIVVSLTQRMTESRHGTVNPHQRKKELAMTETMTKMYELTEAELDAVAAGAGSLIDVDVDVKNVLNNNNIAVLSNAVQNQ